MACSKVSQVSTQNIIGTPESICASCKPRAAAVPRAEYRSLPGIGHAPQIEAPDRLVQLVEDLMREAGLAGSAPLSG